jgi:hypothetical protein
MSKFISPTRTCLHCQQTKPSDLFRPKRNCCKACFSIYSKNRRQKIQNSAPIIHLDGKKTCSLCKKTKDISRFHKIRKQLDHLDYYCKKCRRADSIDNYFRRIYKITLKDYKNIYKQQNKVCKICKKPRDSQRTPRFTPLDVDHCHKTSKVRGLLCRRCNLSIAGLEWFLDGQLLPKALDYLSSHHCNPAQNTV